MQVNNVSFGKVVSVSAKPSKLKRINNMVDILNKKQPMKVYDVTYIYKNISGRGVMAKAAARGENIEMYVLGDDVEKIYSGEKGWKSVYDIASSKIQNYIDARKMAPVNAAMLILNA